MVTVHEKPRWEEEREIRMEKLSETQARVCSRQKDTQAGKNENESAGL